MITLTYNQKLLLRMIVGWVNQGLLAESFIVTVCQGGCTVRLTDGRIEQLPVGTDMFNVLVRADYLHCAWDESKMGLASYVLLGSAEKAVASHFAEPPPPPPAQSYATTITGGTGFQFGNHNQMTVQMLAETIAQAVNDSTASAEQKAEAKGLLTHCLGNPVVGKVLGDLASGLIQALTK